MSFLTLLMSTILMSTIFEALINKVQAASLTSTTLTEKSTAARCIVDEAWMPRRYRGD